MDHSLWAFIGIALVVIAIPGPDTALTIRNTLAGGRTGGLATALGIVAGQIVWELAASLGLVAILLASERVFHAIKLLGAVYLIVLGVQSLAAALRRSPAASHANSEPGERRRGAAFRQGLLSNLGNPKMAVFFAGVFPQFAPHGHETFRSLMLLGLIFSTMTLLWLAGYVTVIERAAGWFRKPRFRRSVEAVSGVALVGLGARLALEPE